jgi:hypothetical protein
MSFILRMIIQRGVRESYKFRILQSRLGEFEDYVPYMDAELQKLYAEAKNLLDIEVVDADAKSLKKKFNIFP